MMKHILISLSVVTLILFSLTGCAQEDNTEMLTFRDNINTFCDKLVELDSEINSISNESGDEEGLNAAKEELLSCLDELEVAFSEFSDMDFPEEFDYLEDMATEAAEYMTEAVNYYHVIYDNEDKYNVNMEEYANENYERAYKRVQVIVALFRGETPEVEGLTIE